MASATTDVIGSTPLSFTNTAGGQQAVPLSALEFTGSAIGLKTAWQADFDAGEQTILLALAKALAASGELAPPPVPPPAPALAVAAAHPGPEGNGITVTVSVEQNVPVLAAKIAVTAIEVDTWAGLADGPAATFKVGLDTAPAGDPPAASGLIAIKKGSIGASAKPAVAVTGVLTKATGVDLKDADNAVVCTILPRADYAGKDGLSFAVTTQGATFTLSATYDSTKEAAKQNPVTLLTVGALAGPAAYLVSLSPPPRGAALPADSSAQLSGGAAGLAAGGLLYT